MSAQGRGEARTPPTTASGATTKAEDSTATLKDAIERLKQHRHSLVDVIEKVGGSDNYMPMWDFGESASKELLSIIAALESKPTEAGEQK